MTTKAQILAAARRIVAASKKPTAAKKNPAKRIGTAKPKRASQATGKAPTKRLVSRRKANTTPGYFPNPAEVTKAHTSPRQPAKREYPYIVCIDDKSTASFKLLEDAQDYAYWLGKLYKTSIITVMG